MEDLNIDQTEQFMAFKEAAENGNISAMCKLSECYKNGIGTLPDSKLADHWHAMADGNSKNISTDNN